MENPTMSGQESTTTLHQLERQLTEFVARSDERARWREDESRVLATRVSTLERDLALLTSSVRVLEARVAIYAGTGALAGGIVVSLIEFYLRGLLR